MQIVKQISLSGHPVMFRLNEEAYNALAQYLERAKQNLKADPDREEVLRDLEQSIGEKLTARLATPEQVVTLAELNAVLVEVGPVEGGSAKAAPPIVNTTGKRKLVRIQEGQNIAGVCTGLAAYSNINVDWIRTLFWALLLVTGGTFLLVYFGLAFWLPIVPTRADYVALQNAAANG